MQLFLIALPDAPVGLETRDTLLSHLSDDAQAKVLKYRLPEDSIRSLVGRLAPIWYLRQNGLIGETVTPAFGQTDNGKPMLTEPRLDPPIAYNTSHDGRYVLFGVSRFAGAEIGVDIMQHPDKPWDIQEAIMDQLTTDEKFALAVALSPGQRAELLTTLWSFKEGYVKATGDGIGFGMERIALDLGSGRSVHAVHVDGRDVALDGWQWAYGTEAPVEAEGERPYGWAVFWKGEKWDGQLHRIPWERYIGSFAPSSQT